MNQLVLTEDSLSHEKGRQAQSYEDTCIVKSSTKLTWTRTIAIKLKY